MYTVFGVRRSGINTQGGLAIFIVFINVHWWPLSLVSLRLIIDCVWHSLSLEHYFVYLSIRTPISIHLSQFQVLRFFKFVLLVFSSIL
jgi:hypothetical protein